MPGPRYMVMATAQEAPSSTLMTAIVDGGAANGKDPDVLLVGLADAVDDELLLLLLLEDVCAMAIPPDKVCVADAAVEIADELLVLARLDANSTVGVAANDMSPPGNPDAVTWPPMYCSKSG